MKFNFAEITEGDSSNTKRCSTCKLYLKKSSFCKDKGKKDGLNNRCKDCSNKRNNPKYQKQWREDNKEQIQEYRDGRKEEKKIYDKKYYGENKEHRQEYQKNWQEDNKEHLQEYKDGRKEETKIYNKNYRTQNRSNYLYNTYGITEKEYDDMVREQDNTCAICKEPESKLNDNGYPMRLCVDHDHITGQVRGLLCNKCNLGIGYLRSDEGTNILLNAVAYIEIHNLDDEF